MMLYFMLYYMRRFIARVKPQIGQQTEWAGLFTNFSTLKICDLETTDISWLETSQYLYFIVVQS